MTATLTESTAAPSVADCTVVELRQYTMVPGRREALIELFDREFVESQEAAGMRVIGQFRDADRADRYVWLRGFADMAARRRGLEAFYGGPVWAQHRSAANATMLDASDVLLLRYARLPESIPARPYTSPRPARGAPQDAGADADLYSVLVLHLAAPVDDALRRWAATELLPRLRAAGNSIEAVFETEYARNDYPRLPVRDGEHVLAVLARGAEGFAPAAAVKPGSESFVATLRAQLARPPQFLRLQPTARSLLR